MNSETSLLIKKLEKENSILKQQQIEITEAKELYLKIFEEFPALIWRSRLDKLCDYFNKTWLEFTGRTMEQEFGIGWAEGVHPDDFDFCLKTYVAAFDKKEAFLMEYRMKNKYGEYCWIRDFGRPFYDLDNTFLGYIGSCYDITENKNNELSLIELNATKDKIFSIIAHDLRSPLNNVFGLTELLIENVNDYGREDSQKYLKIINSSAKSTLALLDNLLNWAKSQIGQLNFMPEKIMLSKVILEVIELNNELAKAKNISLNYTPAAEIEVDTDENMLRIVLRNLISNAIKFTKSEGNITVSTFLKPNHIEIIISDNGIGMNEDKCKKLFDITTNITSVGTANEKGYGLGLVLSKEFVEKLGGNIWVESEEGKGSDFKFTLPLNNSE